MFHSTMIKPYTRPYIPIRDLLNPVNKEENSLYIYLVQIVQDQFDPRFKISRQEEFDGVLQKGGVVPFDRSKLLPNANTIRNIFILTKHSSYFELKYPRLDSSSLQIYDFADSGYNTNIDHTSQLGMLVQLVDKINFCHFFSWSSSKRKQSTKSSLQVKIDLLLHLFTNSKSILLL